MFKPTCLGPPWFPLNLPSPRSLKACCAPAAAKRQWLRGARKASRLDATGGSQKSLQSARLPLRYPGVHSTCHEPSRATSDYCLCYLASDRGRVSRAAQLGESGRPPATSGRGRRRWQSPRCPDTK